MALYQRPKPWPAYRGGGTWRIIPRPAGLPRKPQCDHSFRLVRSRPRYSSSPVSRPCRWRRRSGSHSVASRLSSHRTHLAGLIGPVRVPLDAKWTPLPDYGTADADCSQINLQNVGLTEGASRLYGILCLPRAPGKYPALLSVPGAGVRPYRGLPELAGRGLISFQIGIHGIPVIQPQAPVHTRAGG